MAVQPGHVRRESKFDTHGKHSGLERRIIERGNALPNEYILKLLHDFGLRSAVHRSAGDARDTGRNHNLRRVGEDFEGEYPGASALATECFANLCQAGHVLIELHNRQSREEYQLSPSARQVLAVVEGAGQPLEPSVIAERVLITTGTMTSVLDKADALVVVSSGSIDGARSASATLDWLDAHGHEDLVSNSIAVINAVRPRSGKVDMQKVVDHFSRRCRAVRLVPFDPHLEEGA